MSLLKMRNNDSPTHTYLDINVYNAPLNNNKKVPLIYYEQRNSSILDSPANHYYMSIVRFQLQTADLPIFQFKVDTSNGNTNINRGVYTFTVMWKGSRLHQYTHPIIWAPEDLSASVPTSINDLNNKDEYYYAFSVQHIIRVFNQAVRVAFATLYQNILEDETEPIKMPDHEDSLYCFFQSNGAGKWILNSYYPLFNEPYLRATDRLYPEEGNLGLYMNNSLFSILCGFPSCKINENLFRFSITNNFNDNLVQIEKISSMAPVASVMSFPPLNAYTVFIQTHMEYNSTVLMSPILSLVFLSNHVPISFTQDTPPMVIDSSTNTNSIVSMGNISSASNILTDFVVDWDELTSYNGVVQYSPVGEYRLVDLIGNDNDVKQIQFSVYWKDESNNMHQVYLNGGNHCTLKLMFRKKNF